MTSPDDRTGPADPVGEPEAGPAAAPAPGGPAGSASIAGEQSPEDTDAAWGEYPDRTDDHLTRDRPPHWDDY